jgi:hypothetical protein
MRNKSFAILTLALSAGFLYGLWKLFELRFEVGDVYPPYSSLRSDPLGAKVLHDSLPQLPDTAVERNYQPLRKIPNRNATVLILGADPFRFEASTPEELKEYEALAANGNRVVIAMTPVARLESEDKAKPEHKEPPPIHSRWGVTFEYVRRDPQDKGQDDGSNPKVTSLSFLNGGQAVTEVDRHFGNGVVVLLASCYEFGNEALAGDRDAEWITEAIGANHNVVFDEFHLGIRESSGVATLARKYHLQGAAFVLIVLLALFIWKSSTSFLPPLIDARGAEDDGIEARDANSGLTNLLRRNIARKDLMNMCLKEWEASRHGGNFYPQLKIERVRAVAQQAGDADEMYRTMVKILLERNRG